jgi:hypothetical protein
MKNISAVQTTTPLLTTTTVTRALLTCGVIAGPLYLIVGLIQALTRPGFDFTRHPLSVLSNGALGWIHITNLIVTGLLVIALGVGIRRRLRGEQGGTWGAFLIGFYGVSLIGAGVFVADPALGFPVGTPADANTISWHGMMHFMVGGIGFLALIAACFVMARRFAMLKQRGWQVFSILTGVIFFAGFVGIASGVGNRLTLLGFWIGVIVAWSWVSALAIHLRRELPNV